MIVIITITTITSETAARNTHANEALTLLLDKAEGPLCNVITEPVLVAAAWNWEGEVRAL